MKSANSSSASFTSSPLVVLPRGERAEAVGAAVVVGSADSKDAKSSKALTGVGRDGVTSIDKRSPIKSDPPG